MNEREKLTGSSGGRYDGHGGRNMPESSEHPSVRLDEPKKYPRRDSSPERDGETSRGSERKADQNPGIITDVPGAEKLVNDGFDSNRPQDQMIAFMLVELNEFSKQQDLRSVDDARLAMWYHEWVDFQEFLSEEAVRGETKEEKARDADIERVSLSIRKEILNSAKDKDSVKSGFLLREFEKEAPTPPQMEGNKKRCRQTGSAKP